MTNRKTVLAAAAAAGLALFSTAARADVVTPTITQDQANRLSIFHDYGFGVTGLGSGDGTGVTSHGGGYLGTVDIPGIPGSGSFVPIANQLEKWFPALQGIQSTDGQTSTRSYDLSVGYLSGYDSNPEARRVPRDADFIGGIASAAYHVAQGPKDPIVGAPFRVDLSYLFTGVVYEGQVKNADAVQQGFNATARYSALDNALATTLSVNDQFTMLHGEAFLNTTDASVGEELLVLPQLSVEGQYDWSHLQYFFKPIDDAQRPTAERHTVDARLHVYSLDQRRGADIGKPTDGLTRFLRAALRRGTVGYAHVWNYPSQQTGTDYRYEADRVYIGFDALTIPPDVQLFGITIGQGLSASLLYSHEFQDFRFDNSVTPFAGGPGPGHPRKDNLDILTLHANTRLLDFKKSRGTLSSYFQLDVVRDGSNVVPRHFNEFVYSSGIQYRY